MKGAIVVSADFGGGLDLVFDGKTQIDLVLPPGSSIATVIETLFREHANQKKDMFAVNNQM